MFTYSAAAGDVFLSLKHKDNPFTVIQSKENEQFFTFERLQASLFCSIFDKNNIFKWLIAYEMTNHLTELLFRLLHWCRFIVNGLWTTQGALQCASRSLKTRMLQEQLGIQFVSCSWTLCVAQPAIKPGTFWLWDGRSPSRVMRHAAGLIDTGPLRAAVNIFLNEPANDNTILHNILADSYVFE